MGIRSGSRRITCALMLVGHAEPEPLVEPARRVDLHHACIHCHFHPSRHQRAAPAYRAIRSGVCASMQERQMRNRSVLRPNGQVAVFSTMSAAFSPIMIDGALVLPDVSVGMIEASATRRPAMP